MALSDKRAILMVLGGLMHKTDILGATQTYPLEAEDFEEKFHKLIFVTMYNLFNGGVPKITPVVIDNYLCNYATQYKIFQDNGGLEYLENAREMSSAENFDYYYNRLKKFSALRYLSKMGYDVSSIYNDKVISPREHEEMQNKFDDMSMQDIFTVIDKQLILAKGKFISNCGGRGQLAGEGLAQLKEGLKITPEIGLPLQGDLFNAVTRGARTSKLYMRSGASGVGKSRLGLGNAATLSCGKIYDTASKKWVDYGAQSPTLFITTELEFDEIQTPLMAFMSGVQEESILNGIYRDDEEKRVDEAIQLIKQAPLWIEFLPNYTVSEVIDTIRRYHIMHGVKCVVFDYIHSTIKMLQDLAAQSRGMKLREDNVLAMFSAALKDLCNELDIYIETGSQLNASWESATGNEVNQNLLRGSRALADKLDVGCITLPVRAEDIDLLRPLTTTLNMPMPNMVTTFYKVRRSRWMNAKIWSRVDLGTCRSVDLFATDGKYNLLPIEPLKIKVMKEEIMF